MYPLSGVRLYLRSDLAAVRLDDLRDYSWEALGAEWSYKNRLGEIAKGLAALVDRMVTEKRPLALQRLGRYYVGEGFTVAELEALAQPDLHEVTEKVLGKPHPRLLHVS